MRDRAAERALLLRALDVHVDPLVVAGGLGEGFTASWVTSNHSLLPSSVPTSPGSSLIVVVVVMPAFLRGRRGQCSAIVVRARALHPRKQSTTIRGHRTWIPSAGRARLRLTGAVAASTDGWTFCALGHRHWGRAGAAGLLLHRARRRRLRGAAAAPRRLVAPRRHLGHARRRAARRRAGARRRAARGARGAGPAAGRRRPGRAVGRRPRRLGVHDRARAAGPRDRAVATCGWTARATARPGCRSTAWTR